MALLIYITYNIFTKIIFNISSNRIASAAHFEVENFQIRTKLQYKYHN